MNYNYPYYNPYQTQVNPAILQQQARLQQQIDQMYPQCQPQVQQSAGINGRVIDSIDTVMANEVPMTGETALFPTRDMQTIYTKQWQSDGTIKTFKYVLSNDTQNVIPTDTKQASRLSDELTEGIMKRLDTIEQKLDGLIPKTAKKESVKQ